MHLRPFKLVALSVAMYYVLTAAIIVGVMAFAGEPLDILKTVGFWLLVLFFAVVGTYAFPPFRVLRSDA